METTEVRHSLHFGTFFIAESLTWERLTILLSQGLLLESITEIGFRNVTPLTEQAQDESVVGRVWDQTFMIGQGGSAIGVRFIIAISDTHSVWQIHHTLDMQSVDDFYRQMIIINLRSKVAMLEP